MEKKEQNFLARSFAFLEKSSLKFSFKYTCTTYLTNFDKNKIIKQIIIIVQVKVKKKHNITYFHLKYYFRKNQILKFNEYTCI